MITDEWDVAHVCIAVPDLEAAMAELSKAFGVEWGAVARFSSEGIDVVSPLHGAGAAVDGLRAVWTKNGSKLASGGPPFAPIELMEADRFSPAFTVWGCPEGRQYIHHICYWVEDLAAESAHLVEGGFAVELTLSGGAPTRGFAYHRSDAGMRIELMQNSDKPVMAAWVEGGELALDW